MSADKEVEMKSPAESDDDNMSVQESDDDYPVRTDVALWARITKNTDCSTGPLARSFAHSLAPLIKSFALDYSLRSRPPLRSLARSLPRSWDSD